MNYDNLLQVVFETTNRKEAEDKQIELAAELRDLGYGGVLGIRLEHASKVYYLWLERLN